jgi:hypothetical protein
LAPIFSRKPWQEAPSVDAPGQSPIAPVRPAQKWLNIHNEELWTRLY